MLSTNKIFDRDMICHYTNREKAMSILKDKQINFSPLRSCDDPRESKQWNFDFIGVEQMQCYRNNRDRYHLIPPYFHCSLNQLDNCQESKFSLFSQTRDRYII